MTQKKQLTTTSTTYYVSPKGKVHAETCRHCQPDKEGWEKLESLEVALEKNYQLCRLCCPQNMVAKSIGVQENKPPQVETSTESPPETEELNIVTSETNIPEEKPKQVKSSPKIIPEETGKTTETTEEKLTEVTPPPQETENKTTPSEKKKGKNKKSAPETDKTETKSDKDSGKEKNIEAKQEKSPKKEKKKEEKPAEPPKRYKILAGNGCHQAIAEVRGILIPPTEGEKNFSLILPDGFKIEITFQNSKLLWLAHNQPNLLGAHWFRGYPKMKDDKLVSLQVIAWDGNMPTNPRGEEHWEFTGVWTLQKTLTVQRSMMLKDVRKIAKETGFIKKFKYTFINSFEWVKNKKLWSGYVYKVFCKRQGDVLEIKKVVPFACPRIKPVPKQLGDKKPFNSGGKPPFDKNKPFDKTKIPYKPK